MQFVTFAVEVKPYYKELKEDYAANRKGRAAPKREAKLGRIDILGDGQLKWKSSRARRVTRLEFPHHRAGGGDNGVALRMVETAVRSPESSRFSSAAARSQITLTIQPELRVINLLPYSLSLRTSQDQSTVVEDVDGEMDISTPLETRKVQLDESDRANFLALFRAIGQGDGAKAGELMLTRAKEQRCAEPEAFKAGMRELVAAARAGERGAFNLSNLRIGDVLLEVTNLVRTHQVQVDASFTTLVCAIVVLEGLGRQLDPTLDLFSVAFAIGF